MNWNKIAAAFFLASSILAFLTGLAAFIILFALDFNMYWLILSPVILAVYQIPAVCLFWLYKKQKNK